MPDIPFKEYLKNVERALARGDSTEHTHRPALKHLVESVAKGIVATNEPKRSAVGAPDFIVTKGKVPLGYIEAKDVGVRLNIAEESEQFTRYRGGLGNLILTDYLEFRWYSDGEHRLTARLAKVGPKGKLRPEPDGEKTVASLIGAFLTSESPVVSGSKELAERMAAIAKIIRVNIFNTLEGEDKSASLHQQMQGFREVLIYDLSEDQFADMYAQTICYGLFAARCNYREKGRFSREHAAYSLPKTNPFLRRMFNHIAGPELDERITWAVDDLAELLCRADIDSILKDFGKRTKREDPVVHFYETFLAAYDPRMREARGVYYTPEPVVSYIVQSVEYILKTVFNLTDGLADARKIKGTDIHRLLILDPSTGTGTFLHGVVDRIHETFAMDKGMWSGYVSEHLLPRIFGFELLMAPYAVAHMKLGLLLARTGYDFASGERLRVYLTNTLEEAHEILKPPLFTKWIVEEANAAGAVKQDAPVMVVLGNPPYSGHSENRGDWIKKLLDDYKAGCPELKKPAQAKWLSDDYVKFIRFAQWRIEQTGYGVLAFITNHSYLDNPTFRGMRRSLMNTFDDIHILDLHGNSKKKEHCPDGSKDENVFDIQQGVAIGVFVKFDREKTKPAVVRHAHLWGLREKKYEWLIENDVTTTPWETLAPEEPSRLFVPRDITELPEYSKWWKVTDIFSLNGDPAPGILTTHDDFAISWDPTEAAAKVERLLRTDTEEEARSLFTLCSQDQWLYQRAKDELKDRKWKKEITQILYRPFDFRWTIFNRNVAVHRRERVMRHMLSGENMGLIVTRQTKDDFHVLVTNRVMGHKSLAAFDINCLLPLYLYPDASKTPLFGGDMMPGIKTVRIPNLDRRYVSEVSARIGMKFVPEGKGDGRKTFGPEDVFSFIYAILHSPSFRKRFSQFLKTDFPRVPPVPDAKTFLTLGSLGERLIRMHLMTDHGKKIVTFPISGDDTADKVRYEEPQGERKGRVWINATQYFDGVPPEVWAFRFGGYQVCNKWLKDRKERQLSYDDRLHYTRIVAIVVDTLQMMEEVDHVVGAAEKTPIK